MEKRELGRGVRVTLPIFFLLVIGIIEFGWYFFVQHTMQYATREGMRLALVGRTINGPGGQPLDRINSIIVTIKNNAAPAVNPAMVNVSIYKVDPAQQFCGSLRVAGNAGCRSTGGLHEGAEPLHPQTIHSAHRRVLQRGGHNDTGGGDLPERVVVVR